MIYDFFRSFFVLTVVAGLLINWAGTSALFSTLERSKRAAFSWEWRTLCMAFAMLGLGLMFMGFGAKMDSAGIGAVYVCAWTVFMLGGIIIATIVTLVGMSSIGSRKGTHQLHWPMLLSGIVAFFMLIIFLRQSTYEFSQWRVLPRM